VKTASAARPDGRGVRVALLRASFNAHVVDGLLAAARQALLDAGVADGDLTVIDVPGALELPLAAQAAARSGRFDALVALGAVIRGETDHYDHVAREASSGLMRVSLDTGVPVGFGVLTVGVEGQALARAAAGPGNKGAEAARAALAMVHVLRGLAPKPRNHDEHEGHRAHRARRGHRAR
jgi:6,7-dimethyl-8-ribityllumazine synthase